MIAVILLNYNQEQYTLDCIHSLLDSDYQDMTIILIDNGSSLGSYSKLTMLKDHRIILSRIENNCGYVGGVNHGLKIAANLQPDYYLIMNNDTIIDKKAIRYLVSSSQNHNDQCIVSGKVYHYDDPTRLQYIGSRIRNYRTLSFERIGADEIDSGQYDQEVERDLLDDIFWLVPKSVNDKLEGYSELFYFNGESADYALRAKKSGYKLIYTPYAKIWHKGSVSVGGRENNSFVNYWQTRSTLTLRFLHIHRFDFLRFLVQKSLQIFYKLFTQIFRLKSHSKEERYAEFAELKGLFDFLMWLVKKEKKIGH